MIIIIMDYHYYAFCVQISVYAITNALPAYVIIAKSLYALVFCPRCIHLLSVCFSFHCQILFRRMKIFNTGIGRYPDDIWTVRMWTVKFPGDIWTVEIWTVEIRLGIGLGLGLGLVMTCLLYTSPSPRDRQKSRMPSSA